MLFWSTTSTASSSLASGRQAALRAEGVGGVYPTYPNMSRGSNPTDGLLKKAYQDGNDCTGT